ncbi:hypothetical protein BD413DRAFT_622098 [Trametes elegans]|nr:hypothetical protein BD413DRAFT_622098 [Trametes elegans]
MFLVKEYTRAVHLLLAGLGRGMDVDFLSRKLVGVGTCMGCTALVLSQTYQPPLPYVAIVLVEHTFAPFAPRPSEAMLKERDIWPSREGTYKDIRKCEFWGRFQISTPIGASCMARIARATDCIIPISQKASRLLSQSRNTRYVPPWSPCGRTFRQLFVTDRARRRRSVTFRISVPQSRCTSSLPRCQLPSCLR